MDGFYKSETYEIISHYYAALSVGYACMLICSLACYMGYLSILDDMYTKCHLLIVKQQYLPFHHDLDQYFLSSCSTDALEKRLAFILEEHANSKDGPQILKELASGEGDGGVLKKHLLLT